MNIAFFLVPKEEVIYLSPHHTMRQALERMEYHRYSAVPLIDENGRYVGTITEGDLLWKLKHSPRSASIIPIRCSSRTFRST
ncbi:CBS domain-containing protein [Paenibacillus sp. P26]|nr:CBS domain-containing protein [Paenibacillus sp. P26]UUZ91321.1 CBS domain-containing protein [Paenibacillus sp. P25]